MKSRLIFGAIIFLAAVIFLSSFQKNRQKEPWTEKQLMATAELAEKLNSGMTTGTYIFNIGPSGKIKNSITIGKTLAETLRGNHGIGLKLRIASRGIMQNVVGRPSILPAKAMHQHDMTPIAA